MKPHVHSLGAFGLLFSIDDCIGHGIVSLDGGRRLFVTQFVKNDSDVDCLMGHDIQGGQLGLGSGEHNVLDDVRNVQNGPIVARQFFIKGEEEMAACMAACMGFAEVVGITVDSKFRLAASVGEHGFLLRCQVIHELFDLSKGFLCGVADFEAMALSGPKILLSTARP